MRHELASMVCRSRGRGWRLFDAVAQLQVVGPAKRLICRRIRVGARKRTEIHSRRVDVSEVIDCAAALVAPAPADAAPAFVLNAGRDGLYCFFDPGDPYHGEGNATVVLNDGGQTVLTCQGPIDEPPPAEVFRYDEEGPFGTICKIMITPGGRFSIFCSN